MENDLFGNPIATEPDQQEWYLKSKDESSLPGRIKRLKHLHKLNPEGMSVGADYESATGYVEMQWCYIEGFYLSTILLAQSLIERIMHDRFNKMGEEKIGKKGLSAMLKFIRQNKLMDEFLINKIDRIRLIRNPITHLKDWSHEHRLDQRVINSKLSSQQQMFNDAKDALEVATWLVFSRLNDLIWVIRK